jgi:hypothetical protein
MQRSEKAHEPPGDSSHESIGKNRIPQVGDRFLPMDDLGCNQQIIARFTIPGIRPIPRGTAERGSTGRAAWRLGMAAQLRVFRDSPDDPQDAIQAPSVGIRLGDLLPLIAAAQRGNYLWVQDFLDDEVRITADFYDVLCAFRSYRPAG